MDTARFSLRHDRRPRRTAFAVGVAALLWLAGGAGHAEGQTFESVPSAFAQQAPEGEPLGGRLLAEEPWYGAEAGTFVVEPLPFGLLWEPPRANQREPRFYAKFHNLHGRSVIDTGIGAVVGLVRYGPACRPEEGWQVDLLAAAFSRFDDQQSYVGADYRVGLPLTYAGGPWQAKLSFEHTSSHMGDDTLAVWMRDGRLRGVPAPRTDVVRDEFVFGLSRWLGEYTRVYGQGGYSFTSNNSNGPTFPGSLCRADWGVEWTGPAVGPYHGGLFAAFDMDLRQEQDYTPGITLQVGWLWRLASRRSSAGRVAVEYYSGKSPYSQTYQQTETWWAFTAAYDW